jgi:hypothetical protein
MGASCGRMMSSKVSSVVTVLLGALLALAACKAAPGPDTPGPRRSRSPASSRAVAALQAGDFRAAETDAGEALSDDHDDAEAAAVRAIARYQAALSHLHREVMAVIDTAGRSQGFDHGRMRAAMEATTEALATIDADLAVAADDRAFALGLCMACWERDWNHSGEIDDRDRLLFQIEIDAAGERIPEGDPRRKPEFRFDLGDVYWARAMVSFQRALLELILAYRWTDLDQLVFGSTKLEKLVIHLDQPARVQIARTAILAGLTHAERSRSEYLAETDDQAEWVPNPRQRNHPLPLPADQALYDTWGGVLGDLRRLLESKEALHVSEIARLGDHVWEQPPRGFVDVGLMLKKPKDVVFHLEELDRLEDDEDIEGILASILGEYYVREGKATPLIQRLVRMKGELQRGEDSLERKLRYLLWLN